MWYTPRGAAGCALRIAKRAPCVARWVLLTMTVDPKKFSSPGEAYDEIVRDFPRFNRALKRLNGKDLRFARKMELQENGWPHWHMIVDLRKLKRSELPELDRIWRHGMCNVSFIRNAEALRYVLKYCQKGISDGDPHEFYGLPDWVLDRKKRIRWWQTWHFYDKPAAQPLRAESDVPTSEECNDGCDNEYCTIRMRIDTANHTIEVLYWQPHAQKIVGRMNFHVDKGAIPVLASLVKRFCSFKVLPPDLEVFNNFSTTITEITKCPNSVMNQVSPSRVFVSLVMW